MTSLGSLRRTSGPLTEPSRDPGARRSHSGKSCRLAALPAPAEQRVALPEPSGLRPTPQPKASLARPYDLDVALGVNRACSAASNRRSRQAEAEQDRAIIERAQAGDTHGFRQLVDRYERRAFALAVGLVRDEQDAQEIVQEAFLRVHRNLASFNGSSTFFTWLYRIVANLSIDLMRRPCRRETSLEAHRTTTREDESALVSRLDGADPLEHVRRTEIAVRIQRALDALPSYHRGVIILREVEGMSYQEMAEVMGVSKGTIMSRLFHARQKLQRA
ncbi:MAG: sigma-70 family RNA polymerase sigma factor, partial [Polyangiaceae bacterium]|nr:sigma-70 family RNA polymerase sigma factor [Polyangiaceae bacterium]